MLHKPISRRKFIFGVGATAASSWVSPGLASDITDLIAAPARVQLAPVGFHETEVWAYNGDVPGEPIRAVQGNRIRRHLVNRLNVPTTIHWHGIRISNAMDGVSGLTQAPVPAGSSFQYDFIVPDAGTFWFHPHRKTLEQVARGLAAPLIVDEPNPPDVDDDIVLMVNDWRLDDKAQLVADFFNSRDRSHAGRIGNHLTVNGLAEFVRPASRFERLRVRLINAATDRVLSIGSLNLRGYILALDGMPLPRALPLGTLTLAPAQRADLFVDIEAEVGDTAFITSIERRGTYALASFPVGKQSARQARREPDPLLPNDLPALDLGRAHNTELVMEGGAMGGFTGSMMHEGQASDLPTLAAKGFMWSLNRIAGMPEVPLLKAEKGWTVRIKLINRTAFPHAMHLHGHHFHEINGGKQGPARDTVLVNARSETDIAFVANNPGKWMFHCHMLTHQAAGMATWLEVKS